MANVSLTEKLMNVLHERERFLERRIEQILPDFTLSELQSIDFIGRNSDANVTKIAAITGLTRGAISKMTKKMQEQGWITCYQREDNKKEVRCALTKNGWQTYIRWQELKRQLDESDKTFFDTLSAEDRVAVESFADAYAVFLKNAK